jgi:hypothetical protein
VKITGLRYEPGTRTIRTVPGNHWVATLDSWDGEIAPHRDAFGRLLTSGPVLLEALGTCLGLITCHGLAVKLAAENPEHFAKLQAARAAADQLRNAQ